MENADQILVVAKQISENTNAWSNWGSIVMTVISLVASVVTIAGIVMFYYEYKKNKISRSCQKKVVLDLVRHFFVNNVIVELIREKHAEGKRPFDGVFLRFATLASDENLCKLSNSDKSFDEMHQLCLLLRNYNIAVACAEKHFSDSSCSDFEKTNDLDEICSRSIKITTRLVELSRIMKLKIDYDVVKNHLQHYYCQELGVSEGDLLEKQRTAESINVKVADFYDSIGCLDLFLELKDNRAKTIMFI